jgi:hypothetical protein
VVNFGINDLLNTGSSANVELIVSRLLTQCIDITNKRAINALLITSIIPAVGFEDACIKADFYLHLMGMGRFKNAAYVNMSYCFIVENKNKTISKYRINKGMYAADGIHFSLKGKKMYKAMLKHWMLRMNELQSLVYFTKSNSSIYIY